MLVHFESAPASHETARPCMPGMIVDRPPLLPPPLYLHRCELSGLDAFMAITDAAKRINSLSSDETVVVTTRDCEAVRRAVAASGNVDLDPILTSSGQAIPRVVYGSGPAQLSTWPGVASAPPPDGVVTVTTEEISEHLRYSAERDAAYEDYCGPWDDDTAPKVLPNFTILSIGVSHDVLGVSGGGGGGLYHHHDDKLADTDSAHPPSPVVQFSDSALETSVRNQVSRWWTLVQSKAVASTSDRDAAAPHRAVTASSALSLLWDAFKLLQSSSEPYAEVHHYKESVLRGTQHLLYVVRKV